MRALAAISGLAVATTTLVGVAVPAQAAPGDVDITLLATNDFHGRIKSNGVEAGAAVLAGAVKQIRGAQPNTVFAAAGDLIGASTFESFINNDKPTIDALNEAGLDVSAVGNHEFDKGYADLVNRVIAPASASNPDGGASWKYIGANVKVKASGNPALDPTYVKTMGGVEVGFIGAVTEHLPELVSPGGIQDITVTDIPTAVNAEANTLKAAGVDVIVLLVHEGASTTDCAKMDDDPTSDFGSIIAGVNDKVDAIVSGHTHLAYNCKFPVATWAGRAVTERPVVSAGQYGYNLNQLKIAVNPGTGAISSIDQSILPLATCTSGCSGSSPVFTANYPADPATKTIVDAAVAQADVKGAVALGDIAGPFKRAARPKAADPTTTEENRGGESSLGNLVAEAQRWATESDTTGSAQIAFMNPGGLRADMVGNNPAAYPTTLTYKQAANVQPFANTLVNMKLTGAQIKAVLEQQWQPAGSSRPFLRLGVSKGFTYNYDPATKKVTGMWLKNVAIKSTDSYSVTVNSFLSTGGDNFFAFADGTNKKDTGKTDLQGMVDFMATFAKTAPLKVDSGQRAVGVTFPAGAPTTYKAGDTVAFNLSSLALTGAGDVQDSKVVITLGNRTLGSFPVDNTVAAGATDDEAGKAAVKFKLPVGLVGGARLLKVAGDKTGTRVLVPAKIAKTASSIATRVSTTRPIVKKTRVTLVMRVVTGGTRATGSVLVAAQGKLYRVHLTNGRAILKLKPFKIVGKKSVRIRYLGNGSTSMSRKVVTLRAVKKR